MSNWESWEASCHMVETIRVKSAVVTVVVAHEVLVHALVLDLQPLLCDGSSVGSSGSIKQKNVEQVLQFGSGLRLLVPQNFNVDHNETSWVLSSQTSG